MVNKGDKNTPDYAAGFRRALFAGAGFNSEKLKKPLVGVLNTWGEISPATRRIKKICQEVKEGVLEAEGTPMEFCLSGLCDGTCAGTPGASNYNMVWREVAAAYIECVVTANQFDALIMVAVCDETVPACLIAAARLDIPVIIVSGGSMRPGKYRDQDLCLSDPTAAYLKLKRGEINQEDYQAIESNCLPGAGACGVMGTGITMQIFSEVAGITLSGTSVLSGDGPEILAAARNAGRQIMKLQALGLTPERIFTKSSIENGIRAVMASGGSTCAIFHIMALAAEIGEELSLEDFRKLGESTPLICDVLPGGRHTVERFNLSGGVPVLLKKLAPMLHQDCPTVSGLTVKEILASIPDFSDPVIRDLNNPLASTGGIGMLYGSLAPEGAVSKPHSAAPQLKHHRGPAKPYDSEKAFCKAIMAGELEPGDVAIVRYAGPRGGPGMPCLYSSMWLLRGYGLDESVALVSDGRVSGTIKGAVVAHVAPEAADGGPIALVEKGDLVEIDLNEGRIDLLVPKDLLAVRAVNWKPPRLGQKGFLEFYRKHVKSTQKGAYMGDR